MMVKQYIEITEEMCGTVASRQIPVPGTIDTLKKVWKHFCKVTSRMYNVNVYACVVTEQYRSVAKQKTKENSK